MPSLWPFRRPSQTPASYERHLARLSTRIHASSSSLASKRAQARRFRALWTLYSSIAYLVYLIIALLVVGWRSWGPYEVSAAAGGPVAIYGIRRVVDIVMGWRVVREEERLQGLKREREGVIRELKEATGYDKTRGLLDKYGGEKKRRAGGEGDNEGDEDEEGKPKQRGKRQQPHHQQFPQRTGFAPPPTANIPGRQSLPPGFRPSAQQPPSSLPSSPQRMDLEPSASFAPNAYPGGQMLERKASPSRSLHGTQHQPSSPGQSPFSPPLSPTAEPSTKWYDRLLDVLLGDDESAPRNRLALLCSSCGLVNGLAPPGYKTLQDVGKWKCSGCGAVNGQAIEEIRGKGEDEALQVERHPSEKVEIKREEERERAVSIHSDEEAEDQDDEDDGEIIEVLPGRKEEEDERRVNTPARGTRSRKGKKK